MKILILSGVFLGGCAALEPPQSLGDQNSGFRYIALDPLPVSHGGFDRCAPRDPAGKPDLLDALPNLASRVATQTLSSSVGGGIAGVTIGVSGSSYEVIQDFIAYDETNLRFEVPATLSAEGSSGETAPRVRVLDEGVPSASGREIVVPVYVGVGLRLSATVFVRSGSVNLTDLGAISAAAKAEKVTGGLVVQSIGLNGPKVAAIMPLPGELNSTTIQNATVAIGSIKALLYADDTQRRVRVVGIHYPFPHQDPAMINAITAALARHPVEWRPCENGRGR
jgi:hypothetical protein